MYGRFNCRQEIFAAADHRCVAHRSRSHGVGTELHREECDEAVYVVLACGFCSGEVSYCSRLIAASDMAVMPVRRAGSAIGAKTLEWSEGRGSPEAIFAGSTAPSQKSTVGMERSSRPKRPKSSETITGSRSTTLSAPSAVTSAVRTFLV